MANSRSNQAARTAGKSGAPISQSGENAVTEPPADSPNTQHSRSYGEFLSALGAPDGDGPPYTHTISLGTFEPCEKCGGEGGYWNRTGATEAELERCESCDGEGGWWVTPLPSYTITVVNGEAPTGPGDGI